MGDYAAFVEHNIGFDGDVLVFCEPFFDLLYGLVEGVHATVFLVDVMLGFFECVFGCFLFDDGEDIEGFCFWSGFDDFSVPFQSRFHGVMGVLTVIDASAACSHKISRLWWIETTVSLSSLISHVPSMALLVGLRMTPDRPPFWLRGKPDAWPYFFSDRTRIRVPFFMTVSLVRKN